MKIVSCKIRKGYVEMGPTFLENKCIFLLFVISGCSFILLDCYLILRIENSSGPLPLHFNTTALPCTPINPFCILDTKSLLLDWMNFYVYNPLSIVLYRVGHFATVFYFVSANSISVSHVLVAVVAARLIAHDSLCVRRLGVVCFEVRNFLDAFDGTVARARRSGNPSVNNSMGWYMDGICDGLGTILLLIACFVYLRNHPIKKTTSYSPLPTTIISWTDQREKENVTHGTPCLGRIMFSFRNKVCRSSYLPVWIGFQWLINSIGWNRYILKFATVFEAPVVSERSRFYQGEYLRNPLTIFTIMFWRLINVHAATEVILMSVFLDKLAECLVLIHLFGWILVGGAIFLGEFLVQNVQQIL